MALQAKLMDTELQEELDQLLPPDYRKRQGFSTALVNQHYASSVEELYVRAKKVLPRFRERIELIAQATHGEAMVAPLKGEERAVAKAKFKYADISGGVAWYRLTDIVRATIVYPTIDTMCVAISNTREPANLEPPTVPDRHRPCRADPLAC